MLTTLQSEVLLYSEFIQQSYLPELIVTETSNGSELPVNSVLGNKSKHIVLGLARAAQVTVQKYLISLSVDKNQNQQVSVYPVRKGKFSFLVKKIGRFGSFQLRLKAEIKQYFNIKLLSRSALSYKIVVSAVQGLNLKVIGGVLVSKQPASFQLRNDFTFSCKNVYGSTFKFFFLSSYFGKCFLAFLMSNGERQKAEKIFKKFLILFQLQSTNFFTVICQAIQNTMPLFEIREVELPGMQQISTTIVPVYNKSRRIFLFFKYLSKFLESKKRFFVGSLVDCFLSAARGEGEFYMSITNKYLELLKKQGPVSNFRW